jgi:hypothetical protein
MRRNTASLETSFRSAARERRAARIIPNFGKQPSGPGLQDGSGHPMICLVGDKFLVVRRLDPSII